MVERLNEKDLDGNMDDAANAVFKEVLGHPPSYATGLGHTVIPEPSLSLRNNMDYQRIIEENENNKNDANFYKSQFEALRSDLLEFKNQFQDYEKLMNIRMTELESQRVLKVDQPVDEDDIIFGHFC
ncbi:uncharacterized protein LOC109013435 [Juglans regia]|uniref:Uncharacterized protein LOC109013435 n=1 Tax=Juglans regia TaxID=51240 RepID=A0A6P9E9F4_JUGRE|nr:uncharacterized protein LOC109013435 [Juglans regia]XP_035544841.1 uncharacterized protein LOC109013435 [Juglans regia]